MKKIIALALSVLMILTCLVGCGDDAASNNLDSAVSYLENMYQTGKKDEAMKLSSDKDVLSVVVIDGVSYNVEWTVEVTEGDKDAVKIAESETENCVKIDIPDLPEADILFTANATVKDEEDNTATASFKYKVVGIVIAGTDDTATILEDAYALAEGAKMDGEVTLTGKITSVDTPYDAGYKNLTVTIVIEGFDDKPIKCYRLAGEGADTLAVGDTITVTGIIANYKGTIEFEQGCVVKAIVKADGTTSTPSGTTSTPSGTTSTPSGTTSTPSGTTSTPTGTTSTPSADKKPTSKTAAQIVAEAYALKNGESLSYVATLTGKVNNINTPYTEDFGGQISVTISVEGKDIYCYKMKGTGVDKVAIGDTITVTGVIKNYNGTVEFAWDQASETEVTMNKRVAGSGTVATLTVVDNPVAGTAYKFGMVQKNANNTTYYVKGGMSGYYMATTALPTDAADVYIENTTGGFYLYYIAKGTSTKTYINMETAIGGDGREHVNPKLESTAKTVYTYDATRKTLVATATKDGKEGTYAIGTRNDKSYSTVGPVDVSYDGFHCQFYK